MKISHMTAVFLFTVFTFSSIPLFSQNDTSSPSSPLQIIRLDLSFQNGQYYQIVKKGEQVPRLRCHMLVQGNGTINGHWLINDQVILPLQIMVSGFKDIYLTSRQMPTLPAQDSGIHSITLHFPSPLLPSSALPVLRYFVTIENPLKAISPLSSDAFILGEDVSLQWGSVKGEYQYQIAISQIPFQFLRDNQIIWMPPIVESRYALNSKQMLAGYVYWLIRAVSSTGRIVSASEINSFLLKEKLSVAPDEVKK